METWFTYVRPRYKKALDRWNKDTGGGDGTPAAFVDYCSNDRWLVWVFLHDYDANFLLANNASGRVPNHLQLEAGFDTGMSTSMSDITEDGSKITGEKMRSMEQQLADIKNNNENLNGLTTVIGDYLKAKMRPDETRSGSEANLTPAKMSYDQCLQRANYYKKQIIEVQDDDTLDDDIKEKHLETLKARRKRFLMSAIEQEENKKSKN